MQNPAECLVGQTLIGGWRIVSRAPTGGNFSVCYFAERNGEHAFVKAIDLMRATGGDFMQLADQVAVFAHERQLLEECKQLKRVVTAIGDGQVVPGSIPDTYPFPVYYLVFELADGDATSQADLSKRLAVAHALRSLHHVFVGISQLHGRGIAHQDLKPANVLHFNMASRDAGSKVADVGRAVKEGAPIPAVLARVINLGDRGFAAPELYYGHAAGDWREYRFGADLYLAGNLIVYYFVGASLTALFLSRLDHVYLRENWTGTYEQVLPHIRDAIDSAISEDIEPELESYLAPLGQSAGRNPYQDLLAAIRQLCDPDFRKRGHPQDLATDRFSFRRYIALLDRLATLAEVRVR